LRKQKELKRKKQKKNDITPANSFFEQEADGELTTTLQWEKEIKSDNGKIFLMTFEMS
jgi:hypothetical protein